jgi:hypothetical protein
MSRHPGVVAALLVVLLAALTACSSTPQAPPIPSGPSLPDIDNSTSAAAPTTPAAAPIPPTTVRFTPAGRPTAAQARVLTAYRGFWTAIGKAFGTGDVTALAPYTLPPAATTYPARARALHAARQTQQGPIALSPRVLSMTAVGATVQDCADLTSFRVYDATGKPLNRKTTVPTSIRAQLSFTGGSWRVANYSELTGGCRRT